jgi:hypothetical protein
LHRFYDSATGELDTAKVNMLARPYAQAVAGRYVAMSNDFDAGWVTGQCLDHVVAALCVCVAFVPC